MNKMISVNTRRLKVISLTKHTKTRYLNQHADLRTVHMCVYHCVQRSCTIQHRMVLIIFPPKVHADNHNS